MKQFACGAVVPRCHAVFRAEDDEQILAQVAEHARDDHGIDVVSPELVSLREPRGAGGAGGAPAPEWRLGLGALW
jgi:predicted small metal-binding protein